MKIQDVYTIGVVLHKRLVANGITAATNQHDFERIWREACSDVRTTLERGCNPATSVDTNDSPAALAQQIDWNLFFDAEWLGAKPLHPVN